MHVLFSHACTQRTHEVLGCTCHISTYIICGSPLSKHLRASSFLVMMMVTDNNNICGESVSLRPLRDL